MAKQTFLKATFFFQTATLKEEGMERAAYTMKYVSWQILLLVPLFMLVTPRLTPYPTRIHDPSALTIIILAGWSLIFPVRALVLWSYLRAASHETPVGEARSRAFVTWTGRGLATLAAVMGLLAFLDRSVEYATLAIAGVCLAVLWFQVSRGEYSLVWAEVCAAGAISCLVIFAYFPTPPSGLSAALSALMTGLLAGRIGEHRRAERG